MSTETHPSSPISPIINATDNADSPSLVNNPPDSIPSIRLVPHIGDHRGTCPFAIVERNVPNGTVVKIKRYVEKAPPDPNSIQFRSKVVSRQHAELWSEGTNVYLRDTKSSSGTFVNNVRICPAGHESKPVLLKDGDLIQLGVDYQGRTEDIFKCVRIRIELNRSFLKRKNNPFRLQVIKALKTLALASNSSNGDCCICLCKISPFQALFIAPCCHSFHYKCVRPLLGSWPNFLCPLCRNFADLEASVSHESLNLLEDVANTEEGGEKQNESVHGLYDAMEVDCDGDLMAREQQQGNGEFNSDTGILKDMHIHSFPQKTL